MSDATNNNALNAINPLSYMGVNPRTPPNFVQHTFAPTLYDSKNFQIGALWLNTGNAIPPVTPPTLNDLYVLVALYQGQATWLPFTAGDLRFLTGNSGGPVPPTANNINVVGDGTTVTVVGTPGTSTLTISLVGGGVAAQSFPTDSGTATPNGSGVLNIVAGHSSLNCGSSVDFTGAGNTVTLNVTDAGLNTLIGLDAGNLTFSSGLNTALGESCLHALTSGTTNTAIGSSAAFSVTSGSANVTMGRLSGGHITTGSGNVCAGFGSAGQLTTGGENIIIGDSAGTAYTTSESNNIIIGRNAAVVSESNVIRIGSDGALSANQTKCFINGIAGVSVSNQLDVVIDSTTGQLGTIAGGLGTVTTLHSQDGNNVTPTAGVINVSGAEGITTTGTVGPNTLTIHPGAASVAFEAYVSADINNVTGAGAIYTILFDTEAYDVGSNYNPATGVFTAPATGLYQFNYGIGLSGITAAANTANTVLKTTAASYQYEMGAIGVYRDSGNTISAAVSVAIRLTAGDTAHVTIAVDGEAGNVIDIDQTTFTEGRSNYFMCYRVA